MPDNTSAASQNRDPLERLAGSIERVTFHSEATGFCVLRVKVNGSRDLVPIVGFAASATSRELIECLGVWNNDRQHGLQFKTHELKIVPPTMLEGIEKYPGSGMAVRTQRSQKRLTNLAKRLNLIP